MEGRPGGADDGGIPPKGYLGRPFKPAYRTEDRAEAKRRVRAREIRPWRGKSSGEHTERESSSKRAGERQGTGGGEGRGDKRRRRESDAREGRSPGMAEERQAAHLTRTMGPETITEESRDPMTSALLMCVRANQQTRRGQEAIRQDAQRERGGGGKKKPGKHRRRA